MSQLRALLDALLASGVGETDAAELLAIKPPAGGTWTVEVLNSGKCDEARLTAELGKIFRTTVGPIDAATIDRPVLQLLPGRFVFKHHILPVAQPDENTITLATYDVFNQTARRLAQQQLIGKKVQWQLTPRTQLLRALRMAYGVGADVFEEILKNNRAFESLEQDTALDITNDDPEASVVKFVNQIIREALTERATDIHVEPLENDLRIRYRVDGILHEIAVPPQLRVLQSAIISRLKVMAHMDIAERRLPQDGRINLTTVAGAIDVRVSTIPTVNGESISLRLLSRTETLSFGLDRLDMGARQMAEMKKMITLPNGIILVTGPTGSGKSTTLYSFLSSINQPSRRIITVEEPVEYRLPGISQIDVKSEIGLRRRLSARKRIHRAARHQALPREGLRLMPADRLPRALRDIRGVHRHRGATQKNHPQGNRQRAQESGDGRRHGKPALRRLASSAEGPDDRRGSRPRHAGGRGDCGDGVGAEK